MYKFRAWDKKNKCYIPEWQDATRLIEKHGFNGGDQFVVEQWSGKKDIPGVDIYKGDIIKNKLGRICTVDFHEYQSGFDATFVRDDNFKPCTDLSIGFKVPRWEYHVEIIGTVNENSELLNEPKGNDNDTTTTK